MGGVAGSIRMRPCTDSGLTYLITLNSFIGFTRCAVVIDGAQNKVKQVALAKKPHVIVATPGRLNNHLETTEGFSLRIVKFLVFDEADQLLTLNFQPDIATS
ncbi:hypothetical protein PILCRDRAFT_392721 [Piloderma croceum F 1598]|uniref:Helicase ATP-binding domain-containing protein n=1 Tax=Piloderma croceum (strain F 1598) TaxID=765440 RepID=A0A0C3C4Y2_PILCF|nr:hypothetical protein PILCRDRAFT_392721 [Piloderma croceum F 1598]